MQFKYLQTKNASKLGIRSYGLVDPRPLGHVLLTQSLPYRRFEKSCLEQSTGNRKTRARIPAQSKASLFPQKVLKFFLMFVSSENILVDKKLDFYKFLNK